MQAVQLVMLVAGLALGAIWLAARFAPYPRSDQRWPAMILGVAAGLLGVSVVTVLTMDTVPDEWEVVIRTGMVVAISAVAILGSIYRLTHR